MCNKTSCQPRVFANSYSLSPSSSSFTHLFYLPLSLKNSVSLNISWQMCWWWLHACITLGPQMSELRTCVCVCVCDSYCCSGVWAWALNNNRHRDHHLKHDGYFRQQRKQLQTQQVHRRVEGHESQKRVLDCETERFFTLKNPRPLAWS